ncbi:MAG: glycosyltransferase, partial [Kiloniellales bacterium]
FTALARYLHDGIAVRRIASRLATGGGGVGRLRGVVKAYIEAAATWPELRRRDFDLVHVAGMSASTAAAIWWARATGTPLVIELVTRDASPAQGLPGLRRLIHPNLVRRTAVVAISPALGRRCTRLGLERNVWVRPNPVDETRFFPDTQAKARLRAELTPFADADRVMCAVAKFMPQKNQIFLLDVLARLPARYKLVLAGPTVGGGPLMARDQAYLERLRRRIGELGLGERVAVRTDFVDIADHIKLADLYCMPNIAEGLGTPMLESLACGVPVIANRDEPAFRDWIRDGETGWCRPLDADAWAQAVLEVHTLSPARLQAAALNIRSVASTAAIDAGYRAILRATAALTPDAELDVAAALAGEAG